MEDTLPKIYVYPNEEDADLRDVAVCYGEGLTPAQADAMAEELAGEVWLFQLEESAGMVH